jgi:hypothetical protein
LANLELMLGPILEDGRFVVTNNSSEDVPIGAVFTCLFSRTAKFIDGEFRDRQTSEVTSVALELKEVESWRQSIACVPYGHNAAVRLLGDGLDALVEQVRGKPEHWYVFLSAE